LLALLIPAVVLISLIINPAAFLLNLGTVRAHLALFPAETSGVPAVAEMARAEDTLSKATTLNPGYLQAYELLGRIYAWEGKPVEALETFAQHVALDGNDPLLRYYPSGNWLRQLQTKGAINPVGQNWDDLIQIYSHWMVRYPKRAENYAEVSLIWQCHKGNPSQAKSVLRAGIEQQAQPLELLEITLDQISRSEAPAFCSP
jgi:tetratricopeptide (TPR) repeat protein